MTKDTPLQAALKLCTYLTTAGEHANAGHIAGFISDGADLAAQDHSGNTALHIAAFEGVGYNAIRALIDAGAPIDAKNMFDETPIMRTSRSSIVDALMNAGADSKAVDNMGSTAACIFAKFGKYACLKKLLEKDKSAIDTQNEDGRSPLMQAAHGGHLDCMNILLNKGANPLLLDVNRQDATDHMAHGFTNRPAQYGSMKDRIRGIAATFNKNAIINGIVKPSGAALPRPRLARKRRPK